MTEQFDHSASIFYQSWWLDIAKGTKPYPDAVVKIEGNVAARMSFGVRRPFGFRSVGNCDWTPVVNFSISPDFRADEAVPILRELLNNLPKNTFSRFSFAADVTDISAIRTAFEGAGYKYSRLRNYKRDPPEAGAEAVAPFDVILGGLSKTQRAHIRSASRKLTVQTCSSGSFVAFYGDNLRQMGIGQSRHSLEVAKGLLNASLSRVQGEIMVASHNSGSKSEFWDAAVACVWDSKRYYLWMATRRPDGSGPGPRSHQDAMKLLIVKAMARAQALNLVFDADSPGTSGAQRLYGQLLRLKYSTEARHVFIRHTVISKLGQHMMQSRARK